MGGSSALRSGTGRSARRNANGLSSDRTGGMRGTFSRMPGYAAFEEKDDVVYSSHLPRCSAGENSRRGHGTCRRGPGDPGTEIEKRPDRTALAEPARLQ